MSFCAHARAIVLGWCVWWDWGKINACTFNLLHGLLDYTFHMWICFLPFCLPIYARSSWFRNLQRVVDVPCCWSHALCYHFV